MPLSTQRLKEAASADACWALLERVAASQHLSRAPRLREFLHYVGKRSLRDGCQQIHEQQIGIEVFGRPDTYDTGVDNIVRANATELRKRIEAYFEAEGRDEPLIMEIPRGSYMPAFRPRAPKSAVQNEDRSGSGDSPSEANKAASQQLAASVRRWKLAGAAVLLLSLACCVTLWMQNRAQHRLLYPWKYMPSVGALWSGFFESAQPTDIVMEDSAFLLIQNFGQQTFPFNDYLARIYLETLQAKPFSPEIHEVHRVISGKTLARAAEVRLVRNILVIDPLGSNLHLYNAREYMPELLTRDNVILFGNPTANPWTSLLQSRLNFTMEADSRTQSNVTNHAPAPGEQPVYLPTETISYCVVAYLPKPEQAGKILLIEGTSSEGTEAGGNFLLSEEELSGFQKKLKADTLPYFELLLRVSHVTGTPITTTIEAYRTYPASK